MAGFDVAGILPTVQKNALAAQTQARAATPKVQAATPPTGPTGFWNRITQVGVGQVNLLNATKAVESGVGAVSQAVGSTVHKTVDTTKELAASHTDNPTAYKNASKQTQKDNQPAPSLRKQGVNTILSTPRAVIDVGKKAGQQVEHLAGPTSTQAQRNTVLANQSSAAKNPEYVKAVKAVKGNVGANATITAQKMAASGAKAPAIQSYLQKQANAYSANVKRGAGDAAQIASVDAGGGTLVKLGKKFVNKDASASLAKNVATNQLLKKGDEASRAASVGSSAIESAKKTSIPVEQVSEETKGKVSTNSLPTKTSVEPTPQKNVPFTDIEFRQEFAGKARTASKSLPNLAGSYLKTGSKDPLKLTVQSLVDSKNAKSIGSAVDKLVPNLSDETKSSLVKSISNAKDEGTVKQLLYDASTNAKHEVETISPGKKVTFETTTPKVPTTKKTTTQPLANKSSPPLAKTPSEKVSKSTGTAISGSALKSESRAVEAGVTKELENKAGYTPTSYKADAENAVKLAHENPDKAVAIATGTKSGTSPSHEVAVRRAVENKALNEGDTETLQKLASSPLHSETSQAAQRLGAEAYNADDSSPVRAMQHVAAARTAVVSKKVGSVPRAVTSLAKEIATHEKSVSKDKWQMFVESIKC